MYSTHKLTTKLSDTKHTQAMTNVSKNSTSILQSDGNKKKSKFNASSGIDKIPKSTPHSRLSKKGNAIKTTVLFKKKHSKASG